MEEVMAAKREGWVDMWIGLDDQKMSLGGLAEVRGRFAVGSGYVGGRGWGGIADQVKA